MQAPVVILVVIMLFILVYAIRERQYSVRFSKYMEFIIRAQFYTGLPSVDSYKRGSITLELCHLEESVKSVVITQLRFSDPVLQVTTLDNIYFKSNVDKSQILSVSFRARKRDLVRIKGKNVQLYIRGKMTDQNGSERIFKTRIQDILNSSDNIWAEADFSME